MIVDLKPYPAMKDSSVPWLGEVPKHWEVLPNRAVFNEVKERDHPDADMLSVTITKGVIRQRSLLEDSSKKDSSNQDKSSYKLVRSGDITYNKMRAWQGAVGVSEYDGIVSPAYVVQRPREGIDSRYLHYLLRTPAFAKEAERWSYGITSDMWSLRPEHFKMIYSCVPPLHEQGAIVRFLDYADRRIRRYVRAKQRLIELLEEQKQAIIHRAVTRGLDPNVRLKPSGVEWLGDVPEQWEVRKIGAISTRVTKGTTPTTLGKGFTDAGIRFVKVETISKDRRLLAALCTYVDAETDALLARSRLRIGDVLVAIAGAIGRVGVVFDEDLPANCNQAVAIVTPSATSVMSDWLAFVLGSPACQRVLNDRSVQSAQANLSLAELRGTMIPVPPMPEQSRIVESLLEGTVAIAHATASAAREIDLLREYRTGLIADVVTGKLDVREAAARLPDEIEEAEPVDEADALADIDDAIADDLDAAPDEAEA